MSVDVGLSIGGVELAVTVVVVVIVAVVVAVVVERGGVGVGSEMLGVGAGAGVGSTIDWCPGCDFVWTGALLLVLFVSREHFEHKSPFVGLP